MDYILANISGFVKNEGFIHFYTFKPQSEIPELIEKLITMGLKVDYYRRCGNVAPGVSRWGLDLKK
ncbi:hypothetical protein [Methanohalobium sp.]|uniref:hypothetical protein n=1 Tax=Methanohalobium sp. TaxID=2837493 RepID=UPI00397A6FFE